MKSFMFLVLGLCVAVLMLPLLAQAGDANAKGPVGPGMKSWPAAPLAPQALSKAKLKNTVVTGGTGGAATSGFVPLDSLTELDCPTATCTYEVIQNAQAASGTAPNRFAICTEIDGVFMSTVSCPYLGLIPNDGWYHAGSFIQLQTLVPFGVHFVQSFLYTDNGSTVANWGFTYHVYKQ